MPRFTTYTTDDVEAIVQEMKCASTPGPFFKVGGEYIHASDVVGFEGPEKAAKFKLSDGRTVQHDQYGERESGDLLYRALRVIRRPIGKSQLTEPSFNYLAAGGYLMDENIQLISELEDGDNGNRIHAEENLVFGYDDQDDILYKFNLNGYAKEQVRDMPEMYAFALDRSINYAVYGTSGNGNGYEIKSVSYDGNNVYSLYQNIGDSPETMEVDPGPGTVFFTNFGDELYKANLDGSNLERIVAVVESTKAMTIDRDRQEIYVLDTFYYYGEVYDYNGNLIRNIGQPERNDDFQCRGFDYNPRADELVVVTRDDDTENKNPHEVIKTPRTGEEEILGSYGVLTERATDDVVDTQFKP